MTKKPVIRKWSEIEAAPLTEETVRSRYAPPGHYRITFNRYPPGTDLGGVSRASTLYILSGECQLQTGVATVALAAGDIFESPEGDFHIKVTEDEELRMVTVWELPPKFWRPTD